MGSEELVERIDRLEDRANGGEPLSSRGGSGRGADGELSGALWRLRQEMEARLQTETQRLSKKLQTIQMGVNSGWPVR